MKKLFTLALILMSMGFIELHAQTLNFTSSRDTIYENEIITFTNTSTGFNQSDQFKWEFDSCLFISLDQNISGAYLTDSNDSLLGFVTNMYADSIKVTLSAYDSLGNPIGPNPFSISYITLPNLFKNVWTADSCHDTTSICDNLICNGSFNWLSDTVFSGGQIGFAQPWNQINSPDLFSYYSSNSWADVPNNIWGTQPDHSNPNGIGNYAGFCSFVYGQNEREYITQELQSALFTNQRYELNMYLSLADNCVFANNGVQAIFTDTSTANIIGPNIISTQVNNMVDVLGNNILNDTSSNWFHFNAVYIPSQPNQKYITIGNFKPNSLVFVDTLKPIIVGSMVYAYYYADDISLSPLPPELNLSPQYSCVPGDTIVIHANAVGDSTLLWSTGSTADSIMVAPMVDTFYLVTATDYTRCHSITDTVFVFVAQNDQKPNVWINDIYNCGEIVIDTVELTVHGTGAISYLWNTGDTTASITVVTNGQTQNFSVLVSGSGQYTACTDTMLYVHIYNNLTVSAPVVTGNTNTCDTLLNYRVHNFNPLFQYSWSYNNIDFYPLADSIFAIDCDSFPQLFGGDTLIFRVHDTICNKVEISYFPIMSCCISPDMNLFLNHRDTLDINHAFYNVSKQRIEFNHLRMSINDTLYMDVNTRFYHCDIDMGPYGTIYFRNGDSLLFENTSIYPCDTIMWNSVVVPKSNQHLSVIGGAFTDAIEAFRIENGASSYFEGNSFTNNYKSVSIKNYNPQIPNPYPIGGYTMPSKYNGIFTNNIVQGASNLLLYPKNTSKSRSGIELFDVYGYIVGNSNPNQGNTFRNLEYGIFSYQSEIEVSHSHFENINPHTQSVGILFGGTWCSSGAIVSFKPLSATIPNNPQPAYTPALISALTAHNNTISNSSLGIYTAHSRMDARYNTIVAKHNGIVAHEPLSNSEIRDNTIEVESYLNANPQTDYTGIGILANNVMKKICGINISDNTLNNPPKTGIWIENLSSTSFQITNGWRTVVGNNTVNFTSPINSDNDWTHYGLRMSNCDRALVSLNKVINHSNMEPYYWEAQKGISIRDCKDARVFKNYPITNMGTGIHVIGNNINTQFYCNSVTNTYNGFYFENGSGVATFISDQGSDTWATDNLWNDGTHSNKRIAGKINLDINQWNVFWFFRGNGNISTQVFNPQIPLNSAFSLKLYEIPGNASPTTCTFPTPNPGDPDNSFSFEVMRDKYFGEIVRDEIDFEVLAEEFGYFNGEYFFEEMEEYEDWLTLGTWDDVVYQNFYNYLLNSNIGEF